MKRTPFRRKPGKEYKGLKRTPFKSKPEHKKLKPLGKKGKKWAKDRAQHSKPEAERDGITYCTLNYEGCWHTYDGNAHSLKSVNRTLPEHDWETIPACNHCHEILERMGITKMAAEVRRIRESLGWPTWPEEDDERLDTD